MLATAGRDSLARVWNLGTGRLLAELPHPSGVNRVQFSADGTEMISSSNDSMLRAWDWRSGKLIEALAHDSDAVHDFALSADRRWLITLGWERSKLSDWRTKTQAGPLWGQPSGLAMEATPEFRRAVVGGFTGSLTAYDLEAMVRPAQGSVEELVEYAELVAGRRILSQGNVVMLSSAEWAERWERLQRANPGR